MVVTDADLVRAGSLDELKQKGCLVVGAGGHTVAVFWHEDRAWALLHFVTGPVGSRPDVETGWSVPVFASLDGSYFARFQGRAKNLVPAIEGPKYPSKFPVWTNPNYAEAWRRIQAAIDLVFQGRGTAGDILAAARPEVDAILAQPERS